MAPINLLGKAEAQKMEWRKAAESPEWLDSCFSK
jgi:hypothetical protein